MIKKTSKLKKFNDIVATKKRVGERDLSAAQLKLVAGGMTNTQGGTSTTCDDCDC